MAVGDWWSVYCGFYRHHFIEGSDGNVIHLYGESKVKSLASIRIDPEFIATGGRSKQLHRRGGLPAAQRAMSRVGEAGWAVDNTCEHFARWCVTGEHRSEQVELAASGLGVGVVSGAATSVGAVAAAGVPGLSAIGVSTGLAAIGATVGGGIAAGVAMTMALPIVAGLGLGLLMLLACNERRSGPNVCRFIRLCQKE